MWSRLAMCIMNSNIQNSAYITVFLCYATLAPSHTFHCPIMCWCIIFSYTAVSLTLPHHPCSACAVEVVLTVLCEWNNVALTVGLLSAIPVFSYARRSVDAAAVAVAIALHPPVATCTLGSARTF